MHQAPLSVGVRADQARCPHHGGKRPGREACDRTVTPRQPDRECQAPLAWLLRPAPVAVSAWISSSRSVMATSATTVSGTSSAAA